MPPHEGENLFSTTIPNSIMKNNPLQILTMLFFQKKNTIQKAKGVTLSILDKEDATFHDILLSADGALVVQFVYKDCGQHDHLELAELSEQDLTNIINAIN